MKFRLRLGPQALITRLLGRQGLMERFNIGAQAF